MNYKISRTDGRNPDFIELCRMLDRSLDEIVGGAFQRAVYSQYNRLDDIHDAVVIYVNALPAASGSFKHYDGESAEIKRVFVKEQLRGRGISRILMTELEKMAVEKGYRRLILETGTPLKASMELYRSIGFRIIENYGQYKDMKESICMEKKL